MGRRPVRVAGLVLEVLGHQVQIRQALEHPRPAPEHGTGSEHEGLGIERERHPRGERLHHRQVRAPVLRPGQRAWWRHDPDVGVGAQQREQVLNLKGRREHSVEQPYAPGVAVEPVRGSLGVHLEDRLVAVEMALVGQPHQWGHVTAEVRYEQHPGLRVAGADLGLDPVGSPLHEGDDEVERLGDAHQTVGDVAPHLGVVHVGDDEDAGAAHRGRDRSRRAEQGGVGDQPRGHVVTVADAWGRREEPRGGHLAHLHPP